MASSLSSKHKLLLHEALLDSNVASLENIVSNAPDSVLEGASPILIWFSEHDIEASDHSLLNKIIKFKSGNQKAFRQSEYIFLLKFTKFIPYYDMSNKFERLFPVQKLNFVRTLLQDCQVSSFMSALATLGNVGLSEFINVLNVLLMFDSELDRDIVKRGIPPALC